MKIHPLRSSAQFPGGARGWHACTPMVIRGLCRLYCRANCKRSLRNCVATQPAIARLWKPRRQREYCGPCRVRTTRRWVPGQCFCSSFAVCYCFTSYARRVHRARSQIRHTPFRTNERCSNHFLFPFVLLLFSSFLLSPDFEQSAMVRRAGVWLAAVRWRAAGNRSVKWRSC